jgi:tetratricopeptide (TPR) repeat protein
MPTPRAALLSLALAAGLAAPAFAGWDEGVAAYKAGNFAQAANEFQAVVNERPDWAGGYLMLGQTQLKLDRNEAAVASLRKAYDLNPSDTPTQLALARAYLEVRRYGDASELLKRINAGSLPKDQQGQYHQMVAVAASKTGQTDGAVAALRQAASASPNNADAQYAYGAAALAAGDTTAAVSALEKAVRLDANDVAKHRSLTKALIALGRETRDAAPKKTAYTKAVDAARALTGKDPSYDSLLLLGEAQLGATQYDQAAATFGQAATKNANDWLVYFYQGQAYTAAGDYGKAEPPLKQALGKSGADARRIWRQLGFVYEKQKNFAAAVDAYNKAGDSGSVARVQENEKIAAENKEAEEHNRRVKELEEEAKRLEEEMKRVQGQGKPPAP